MISTFAKRTQLPSRSPCDSTPFASVDDLTAKSVVANPSAPCQRTGELGTGQRTSDVDALAGGDHSPDAPSVDEAQTAPISHQEPAVFDEDFIKSIYPGLHRAAWKMTGDCSAADDLAQETLIVAFTSWDSFDARSRRSTWMHGILIHLTRKHFRTIGRLRRRIENYVGKISNSDRDETTPDSLARAEWQQSIWAQVWKLPRKQAEAIALRYGEQLSYEETAQAIGCAVGTAKSRVHQGLKRLRQTSNEFKDLST